MSDHPTPTDPLVLVSALRQPLALVASHATALRARADSGDFMTRARLDEILAAAQQMQELLEDYEESSGPVPIPSEPPAPDALAADRLLQDLRREFPEPTFIAELVGTWQETASRHSVELRAALEARDRQAVLAHAHALVAPARTMGALRLAALASGIEREAPDGIWEELAAAVAEVEVLVPEVAEQLDALI